MAEMRNKNTNISVVKGCLKTMGINPTFHSLKGIEKHGIVGERPQHPTLPGSPLH